MVLGQGNKEMGSLKGECLLSKSDLLKHPEIAPECLSIHFLESG